MRQVLAAHPVVQRAGDPPPQIDGHPVRAGRVGVQPDRGVRDGRASGELQQPRGVVGPGGEFEAHVSQAMAVQPLDGLTKT